MTNYGTKHFAATVEAIDSSAAIIVMFFKKLLSQGKVLGLFCPKERVNILERSLQKHSLGLEFEYFDSRIMDGRGGAVVMFCSSSVLICA